MCTNQARAAKLHVSGLRTALRVSGSGPPLLLLHGLGCSHVYFRPLQRQLGVHFTVHAPDLPGHGQSAKPRGSMWRVSELTDWVADLIQSLQLEQPIIVGHSLGGGIAVDLAVRYREHTRGVVLVAPTGVPDMPPLLGQLPLLLADGWLEPWRLFPLIVPAYMQAGPRRIARLAIDQTRYGQRQQLQQMTTPVLVIRGSRDPLVTDDAIVDLKHECASAQTQEIADAAHAVNVSHPHCVAELITNFARALP